MHWYLKIPRFDGRKTLAFNGLVFIAASGWLTAAYTGLTGFGPVGETGLHALAAVAALNGLLRLVTERPVWWRQWWHVGMDEAAEGADETVYFTGGETVYRRAAEFVKASDFTDIRESEAARRILPYADFSRDLDKALCRDVRAVTGIDDLLPLDADERAN